jgi:hypothetical protein
MYKLFSVDEVPELFTVYDYKQLIKAVEAHFNESAKYQDVVVNGVVAYYNPELNQGIIHQRDDYEYILLEPLQLAYGTDFITIKFK